MDADAQFDDRVAGQFLLHGQGAVDRINHGAEFDQPAIAHAFDHFAAMLADHTREVLPQFPQRRQRGALVRAHQTRIARHIGGQDGGKLAG